MASLLPAARALCVDWSDFIWNFLLLGAPAIGEQLGRAMQ
jgi:hypothetical protein